MHCLVSAEDGVVTGGTLKRGLWGQWGAQEAAHAF